MICSETNLYSSFLKEFKKCFEKEINSNCNEKVVEAERIQLMEYYRGNLKCQTSILGLQTELIRYIYFERNKEYIPGKTIPFLIKNC